MKVIQLNIIITVKNIISKKIIINIILSSMSQDSDWLQAGQSRNQSSSPGRVKNFLFFTSSRPTLGSTQPPIQRVPGALSLAMKQPGHEADHSPPASAEVKENVDLYIHSPICLHGIVFN
jgi:hypothetical protein